MEKEIFILATKLGETLKEKKIKIATAESCTGGGVAQALTDIAGSSAWFDRGFVSYSNPAKVQMLQVKQGSLDEKGAVSKQVAIEMAEGALVNSDADLAVSVTGIAGPTGGSDEKPVGTVYIACKIKGKNSLCKKYLFSGNRQLIRQQTIQHALSECIKQCSE